MVQTHRVTSGGAVQMHLPNRAVTTCTHSSADPGYRFNLPYVMSSQWTARDGHRPRALAAGTLACWGGGGGGQACSHGQI